MVKVRVTESLRDRHNNLKLRKKGETFDTTKELGLSREEMAQAIYAFKISTHTHLARCD